MGYSTEFSGNFKFKSPLTEPQVKYIQAFNQTRRMKRIESVAEAMPDPIRIAVALPIGKDGGYYVGSVADGNHGQTEDKSVVGFNFEPKGQPGVWCKWTTENGTTIEWDGAEKFYDYVEWLQYLITHFFAPWGKVLSGKVKWQGEDMDDRGMIIVKDNVLSVKKLK